MVNKTLNKFYVLKRDGRKEEVYIDKITSRIQKLCYGLNMDYVDPVSITLKVVVGLYPAVTTTELDVLAAETAASLSGDHPDYATLAARIAISNLQKETKKHFSDVVNELYNIFDEDKKRTPLVSEEFYKVVTENADRLNSCIIYDRDFAYNYFAFKELENSFLLKINGKVVERPQHMLMRVAVQIHLNDIDAVIQTYNLLSEKYYIHCPSTLLLAGTLKPQLCSSFSMMMPDDSIEGIFECVRRCGIISKYSGTIGVSMQNIRAKGTYIAGTNGISNGLVPMLRVFNNMACYVDQFNTNNMAEIAVYIEVWHADILEFLNLSKPGGKEEVRTRSLFYGLWIPDLFMKRVESNGMWSLMCPHQCKGLPDKSSVEFEKLYLQFEKDGKYVKQIPAQDLWRAIIVLQAETGGPVMMYKDPCNEKFNQKQQGIVKGGSFNGELVQLTSAKEIAACTQASINLNMFLTQDKKSFDFEKLREITKIVAKNLDKVIDVTYSPIEEQTSNMNNRPIGIGVQGLADVFIMLKIPYDSEDAKNLNKQIFETIYYSALEATSELAETKGQYPFYTLSLSSKGILQPDLWNVEPSDLWNWTQLREKLEETGLRNSLMVTQMYSPVLARLLGTSESVDLYSSFYETKRVTSGEFPVINPYLLRDLYDGDLWNDKVKENIIRSGGSVQNINEIPDNLKALYKTAWEVSQKTVIDMAADRAPFIDQSQSLNIHMMNPNYGALSSMHFYGWKKGLKTGMSKLKTKSIVKSTKTNDQTKVSLKTETLKEVDEIEEMKKKIQDEEEKNLASLVCSLQNREACDMCGA